MLPIFALVGKTSEVVLVNALGATADFPVRVCYNQTVATKWKTTS